MTEVERLRSALEQAEHEKCKAAQFGMGLLADKEQLQRDLEETKQQVESLQVKLETTTEKLEEQSTIQRRINRAGIEEHEDTLSMSANRERQLVEKVHDLEAELKDVKNKYESLMSDCDAADQKCSDLQAQLGSGEKTILKLRDGLKNSDAKLSEVNRGYDDLVTESCDLERTILALKTNLTEFESIRHDHERLKYDNEMLHDRLEEITKLKRITEKSLEESFEALQIERDQRHKLRRELDSRIHLESLQQYVTLRNDIRSATGEWNNGSSSTENLPQHDGEHRGLDKSLAAAEQAALSLPQQTSANSLSDSPLPTSPGTDSSSPQPQTAGTETESSLGQQQQADLYTRLESTQRALELASSEVASKQERINALLAQLDTIMSVKSEADAAEDATGDGEEDGQTPGLAKSLRQAENRYSVALRQIASLQHELWRLRKTNEQSIVGVDDEGLRGELLDAQSKLVDTDGVVKQLRSRLASVQSDASVNQGVANRLAGEVDKSLVLMLRVYASACGSIEESPTKQISDLASRLNVNLQALASADTSLPNDDDQSSVASSSEVGTVSAGNEAADLAVSMSNDPLSVCLAGRVDMQMALVRQLRHVVNTLVGRFGQLTNQHEGQTSSELEQAQQLNLKLSEDLQRKRDQLTSLRTTMRASRITAERALEALKQKHEEESVQFRQNMDSLHKQMKELKENEATYSSLRVVFSQRYHEFTVQINELQRKLMLAEEEKRSLNSLLRAAVAQKLVLTQKLETYDVAQEEHINRVYRQQQAAHRHPGPNNHPAAVNNNNHPFVGHMPFVSPHRQHQSSEASSSLSSPPPPPSAMMSPSQRQAGQGKKSVRTKRDTKF